LTLPWIKISSKADALAAAAKVRKLPLVGGEFTCMTRMLRSANDKVVPQIPAKALRVVIDVSGDGPDNCNAEELIETVRDELVANGVTINGLPILLGADAGGAAGAVVPNACPMPPIKPLPKPPPTRMGSKSGTARMCRPVTVASCFQPTATAISPALSARNS